MCFVKILFWKRVWYGCRCSAFNARDIDNKYCVFVSKKKIIVKSNLCNTFLYAFGPDISAAQTRSFAFFSEPFSCTIFYDIRDHGRTVQWQRVLMFFIQGQQGSSSLVVCVFLDITLTGIALEWFLRDGHEPVQEMHVEHFARHIP